MWKTELISRFYITHKWTQSCITHLSVMDLPLVLLGYCKASLVTCVHIYLGADSAHGYLCPPPTVSVSFRFHRVCNTHSLTLNCLERNTKVEAAASAQPAIGRILYVSSCWGLLLKQAGGRSKTPFRKTKSGLEGHFDRNRVMFKNGIRNWFKTRLN